MREQEIIQRLSAGEPSGLEELMSRYIPYVSTVVWNILRGVMPPEDAEEVVSDVFLAAWRQADELRLGHVKGWLGAVARNKAKNQLRRLGRTLPLEDDTLDIPDPDCLADGLEQAEEHELVRGAVDSLPPQDREIFLRHYYYAQTIQEISFHMDLKESTVKTKLRRGRIKLKETLMRKGLAYEA